MNHILVNMPRDALLEVLKSARKSIADDRQIVYSSHFNASIGALDEDAVQDIKKYDALLTEIDGQITAVEAV